MLFRNLFLNFFPSLSHLVYSYKIHNKLILTVFCFLSPQPIHRYVLGIFFSNPHKNQHIILHFFYFLTHMCKTFFRVVLPARIAMRSVAGAVPLSYLGIKPCSFFNKSGDVAELTLLLILPIFSTPEVKPFIKSRYLERNGSM